MLDVSSHGRAAPKTKTINVEANLLAQRIAERERLRSAAIRKLSMLAMVVVASGIVLPSLFQMRAAASRQAAIASAKRAALQKQLAELKLLQDSAKPLIEDKTLLDRLGFFSETFTGQITLLLNAATPDLVFSNLRAEAMGSEVKINCKIDAETYPAAQNFVAAASKGPNVINAMLLSQKRGEELGDSSVSFDFVKRMKVNQ